MVCIEISSPVLYSFMYILSFTHSSFSSDQPSNYYHRASQDGGQPEDAVLFQLSVNDLMDNQYLRKALVPFNQLKIMEEIGFGKLTD